MMIIYWEARVKVIQSVHTHIFGHLNIEFYALKKDIYMFCFYTCHQARKIVDWFFMALKTFKILVPKGLIYDVV